MDAEHRRTYSGSEGRDQLVVVPRSESTMFKEGAPSGGRRKLQSNFLRGIRQGRACAARPLWGQKKIAKQFSSGDKTRTGVRSAPPLGAGFFDLSGQKIRGIRQWQALACEASGGVAASCSDCLNFLNHTLLRFKS